MIHQYLDYQAVVTVIAHSLELGNNDHMDVLQVPNWSMQVNDRTFLGGKCIVTSKLEKTQFHPDFCEVTKHD